MKRSAFTSCAVAFLLLASIPSLAQAIGNCSYQTFQYPGAPTLAMGINHYGNVVGYAEASGGTEFGFIRYADGTYKPVMVPDATSTRLNARNDNGVSVGSYTKSSQTHGLIWNGNDLTTLDYPSSIFTALTGINNYGTIVGYYVDANGHTHGFKYSNGSFTTGQYPDAPDTSPQAISDTGAVAGYYAESGAGLSPGDISGFVFAGGQSETVNDPYVRQGYTMLNGINSAGTLIGTGFSPTNSRGVDSQAFEIVDGAAENLNVPDAIRSWGNGVNRDGVIVGTVELPESTMTTDKGFIAHCQNASPTCHATVSRSVKMCSPTNTSSSASPVLVIADAKAGSSPVERLEVWVDGVKTFQQFNTQDIDTYLPMSQGTHRVTVQAVDKSGTFKSTIYIVVS